MCERERERERERETLARHLAYNLLLLDIFFLASHPLYSLPHLSQSNHRVRVEKMKLTQLQEHKRIEKLDILLFNYMLVNFFAHLIVEE